MNSFYRLPKIVQWTIAVFMLLLVFLIMATWMNLMEVHILYVFGAFLVVPFFQFLATPFFTLTKIYTYLSPMLLVYAANKKTYDLHNGTGFDILMIKGNTPLGLKWRQRVMLYYLEGFLKIIDLIESKELPETLEIRGSSYFFSDQTSERLGFSTKKTPVHEKFNIYLNYLDLIWMYSISKGKLSFPKVNDIKTVSTSGSELLKRKEQFVNLLDYLKNRS